MSAQQGVILSFVTIAKLASSKGIYHIHPPRISAVDDYFNEVDVYNINQ